MITKSKQIGFTIVELLIVIVVIGILAALVIGAYAQAQEKARQAKIDTDLSALEKAITTARISEGGIAMRYITGSTATGQSCWTYAAGTNLATLPQTDGCWTSYKTALAAVSAKSGSNVNGLVDPWGYPYFIDENEQEASPAYCVPDQIGTFKRPAGGGFGPSRDQHRMLSPGSSAC